jgi:chemotaxis protein MotB
MPWWAKGGSRSACLRGVRRVFPFVDNGTEQGRLQNRKVVVAISRFAWVPPAPVKPLTVAPVQDAPQSVDSEKIRVIALPGGGIRITTRQD